MLTHMCEESCEYESVTAEVSSTLIAITWDEKTNILSVVGNMYEDYDTQHKECLHFFSKDFFLMSSACTIAEALVRYRDMTCKITWKQPTYQHQRESVDPNIQRMVQRVSKRSMKRKHKTHVEQLSNQYKHHVEFVWDKIFQSYRNLIVCQCIKDDCEYAQTKRFCGVKFMYKPLKQCTKHPHSHFCVITSSFTNANVWCEGSGGIISTLRYNGVDLISQTPVSPAPMTLTGYWEWLDVEKKEAQRLRMLQHTSELDMNKRKYGESPYASFHTSPERRVQALMSERMRFASIMLD